MNTSFNDRKAFPNIDQLMKLAKNDPEGLERLRLEHIETLINSAPEPTQRRLRGLQFQIDCQRRLHKHPMGACLSISKMMMASLHRLNEALQIDTGPRSPAQPSPAQTSPASVLAFPNRHEA